MLSRALFLVAASFAALNATADTTRPLKPIKSGHAELAAPNATDPDHFMFVLTGDNRAAGRNVPMPPTLDRICTEIGLLRPAFTLWTGDTIYGSDDTIAEANSEYDVFLNSIEKAASPVYNAPGNHEIFDRKEMENLYVKRIGRLYGSFDYGNSHFIALNTEEIGLNGGIGKEQLTWLEQDLQANRKATNIFAFMHHPLFPKPGEKEGWDDLKLRDRVHNLFIKAGVKNVFSGHEHLYYHGEHDGINYYISGGAGAPADASPEEGGFQHYILFKVDGAEVAPILVQPWRLFAEKSQDSNHTSMVVSNYNNDDLVVYVPFSSMRAVKGATATTAYKGKAKSLPAAIVTDHRPGVVTVRVKVPAHRSAIVFLDSPG